MIKQYLYAGTTYATEKQVRKAIWERERKVIGMPQSERVYDFWLQHGVTYTEQEIVLTEEQKRERELFKAKQRRGVVMATTTVEVDGMRFDGSEVSQERMARYILALDDTDSISWVMADDTIQKVTRQQLAQALKLAVRKQSEIWTAPYEG